MGVYKKGNNWFIDYRAFGKRYREQIGSSKRLAETVLQKRKVAIAEGKFLDMKQSCKTTFADMTSSYLEEYSKLNKQDSAHDQTRSRMLVKQFGSMLLDQITPENIESFKKKRIAEGCAKSTVNRDLALMKHIYTIAIKWKRVKQNPVKEVKMFKENNARTRYLQQSEIKNLLRACPDFLRPIVFLALNTGMRQGEILELRWNDVDFTRKRITLRRTKNGESRIVPMNISVLALMDMLRKQAGTDNEHVFIYRGRPLSRFGLVRGAFEKAVKSAGIVDFRFHDLRHTFASHLVMSGADIMIVKNLLGHKTLAMTMRYSHISETHMQNSVESLCKSMDTFWTPANSDDNDRPMVDTQNLLYNKQ